MKGIPQGLKPRGLRWIERPKAEGGRGKSAVAAGMAEDPGL